jgi:hypothetical protein
MRKTLNRAGRPTLFVAMAAPSRARSPQGGSFWRWPAAEHQPQERQPRLLAAHADAPAGAV